jgi:hypothetical protein
MTNQGIQHQLRRGTNSQMGTFTGAAGEPTFDTTFDRLVMHDGITPGGYPHGLATVQTSTGSTTINPTTAVFMGFSTAAAQSLTLPAASAYAPGQVLTILDGAGIAATFNITVNTASATDFFYTSSGGTSTTNVITINGAQIQLLTNSSAHWILMSTT